MDKITRNKSLINRDEHSTKLVGLRRPTIKERVEGKCRCTTSEQVHNFSQLKPDDLALLIVLFQNLDKNLLEYDRLLRDIRRIGEFIADFNPRTSRLSSSNSQLIFVQKNRLKTLMNTLSTFF